MLKALVIGCGRVGSAIALQLHQEGWDVTVVDENEDALSRLGESWPGTFIVGHGMDADLLREAGIEDADAVVVATDGDNTNIIIGQVAQKRFDVRCVVVRVLDPARAKFYAERGLNTCARRAWRSTGSWTPRGRARSRLPRRSRPKRSSADVRHRRRRRQDRRERHPLAAPARQRGDADRAEARPLRDARGRVRAPGAARRRDRALRPRARGHRAAARHRARAHRRRRGQHDHRPDRAREVRRPEGDRARERSAQPAALRPARASRRPSARPRA